ncbi:uncharacterized protein LOC111877683 isoform X1 [Lactuca sativa]|uniref:uncharacterized protein LOC111877683 isoform X1 n=1 Tax=Lactuca sativa TaxID=4236 RepID=UPI0022B02358|nr:uncharacterized protein LOC111877683 isoform X1 [Lactuca sativa]
MLHTPLLSESRGALVFDKNPSNTSKTKFRQMALHFKRNMIVKDLTVMLVTSWMMMVTMVFKMMVETFWIVIGKYTVSWGLDLWVRLELMLLKYEMESISDAYVVPYDYYKVHPQVKGRARDDDIAHTTTSVFVMGVD